MNLFCRIIGLLSSRTEYVRLRNGNHKSWRNPIANIFHIYIFWYPHERQAFASILSKSIETIRFHRGAVGSTTVKAKGRKIQLSICCCSQLNSFIGDLPARKNWFSLRQQSFRDLQTEMFLFTAETYFPVSQHLIRWFLPLCWLDISGFEISSLASL